jgi:hypothetical protein
MRGLLSAIGVCLCSTIGVVSQSAPPGALSATLRSHLQSDEFQIVTSIRGLPLGVRGELQRLFASGTLDIAEPGQAFQGTRPSPTSTLPTRRLIAAGCASDNHCLVYYERAGAVLTRRVMLFTWTPDETRFEWGGAAPAGFATIDDVRRAILAGTIKGGEAGPW